MANNATEQTRSRRADTIVPGALLVAAFTVVLAGRIAGPSDLHTQTQIKTIAYSVDMLNNGRYILPRALDGEPATKPPLYNWLSLPAVLLAGTSEFAFKLPSLVSGILLVLVVIAFARKLVSPSLDAGLPGAVDPAGFAILSATFLVASYGIAKAVFLSRPDMLLALFMTLAWALGTLALSPSCGRPRAVAFLFWLCVAGAFLAKGPAGLIPPVYVAVAAKWIHGSWRHSARIGWWWGLPLAAALFACWQVPALTQDPDFFARLWQLDVVRHAEEKGVFKVFRGPFVFPWYAIIRFLPWSLLSVVALFIIGRRGWRNHFLAPAILYGALVVVVFMFSPGHIWRYIIPFWPAGAMLAAYAWPTIFRSWRHAALGGALAGFAVAAILGVNAFMGSTELRSGIGQNAVNFAREVRSKTGSDTVSVSVGPTLVEPLLGIHPGADRSLGSTRPAAWTVREYDGTDAVVISDTTWEWTACGPRDIRVGLYRITSTNSTQGGGNK